MSHGNPNAAKDDGQYKLKKNRTRLENPHWSRHGFMIINTRFPNSTQTFNSEFFFLLLETPIYRLPRSACSRSIASNRLLKFPAPKPSNSFLWIISMKTVGRSIRGLVKSWSR